MLDVGHPASPAQLGAMHELAVPFIRGVYPTATMSDFVSPIGLTPPLGCFGLLRHCSRGSELVDAAVPYAMVY